MVRAILVAYFFYINWIIDMQWYRICSSILIKIKIKRVARFPYTIMRKKRKMISNFKYLFMEIQNFSQKDILDEKYELTFVMLNEKHFWRDIGSHYICFQPNESRMLYFFATNNLPFAHWRTALLVDSTWASAPLWMNRLSTIGSSRHSCPLFIRWACSQQAYFCSWL